MLKTLFFEKLIVINRLILVSCGMDGALVRRGAVQADGSFKWAGISWAISAVMTL